MRYEIRSYIDSPSVPSLVQLVKVNDDGSEERVLILTSGVIGEVAAVLVRELNGLVEQRDQALSELEELRKGVTT